MRRRVRVWGRAALRLYGSDGLCIAGVQLALLLLGMVVALNLAVQCASPTGLPPPEPPQACTWLNPACP